MFSIHHLRAGVKLLVRLRFGFSHLHEHKFRQNFHDTLNLLCSCSLEPETSSHYLLRYHNFLPLVQLLWMIVILSTLVSLNYMKLLLQICFYTVIQRKLYYRTATFCRVLSNIYLQQHNLMNHSSKSHTHIHDLYYTFLVISRQHIICGAQMRSTTSSLNHYKRLNIKWVEVGDVISILFVDC